MHPGACVGLGGRYEILEECGQGACGVVFRARERSTGRQVAIKVLQRGPLRSGADAVEAVRREAELLTRLDHEGIVRVHEVCIDDDGASLVTELVEGCSLAERLARRGKLTRSEALSIVSQTARAVAAAHARGIVHRDLKPANVLVTPDGRVKVADFGLALDLQDRGRRPPAMSGTPAYAAPEQLRGEPGGPPADVFALGMILHECLTGRLPARCAGAGPAGDGREPSPAGSADLEGEVGQDLACLCREALSDDPRARPAGALEFARRLENAAVASGQAAEGVAAPRPAGPVPAVEPAARRTRALVAGTRPEDFSRLLLAALVAMVFVAAASVRSAPVPGPPEGAEIVALPAPPPAPAPAIPSPEKTARPKALKRPAEETAQEGPATRSRAPVRVKNTTRERHAPHPASRRRARAEGRRPSSGGRRPVPVRSEQPVSTVASRVEQPAGARGVQPAPTKPATASPSSAATPAPEPARSVVELRHPLAAGEFTVLLDGKAVARIRLGDPMQAPVGRPAIAFFTVPPGSHELAVRVSEDGGAALEWSIRESWEAGGFRSRRLVVERDGNRLTLSSDAP